MKTPATEKTSQTDFTPAKYLEYLMIELADIKKLLSEHLDRPDENKLQSIRNKMVALINTDLEHDGYPLNQLLTNKIGELYYLATMLAIFDREYDLEYYELADYCLENAMDTGYKDRYNLKADIDSILLTPEIVKTANINAKKRNKQLSRSMPLYQGLLRDKTLDRQNLFAQHERLQTKLFQHLTNYLNIVVTNSGEKRTGSPRNVMN